MIIEEKKINKISESREKALNFFHKIGLPSRKLERWKYTDLSKKFADKVNVKDVDLLDANLFNKTQSLRDYVEANSCAARIDLNKINDLIQNVGIPGEDSIKLFFKNGNFIEELLDKRLLDNNIIIKKNDQIDNINNQLNYIGADDNKSPELFLGIIMAVPFVDSLTTNLDHSLPLTVGEFDEFGNAKDNKEHFDYIFSYAPYNNIKKNGLSTYANYNKSK